MPGDTTNLMQNVYDYFLNLYNSGQSDSNSETFLSFERIGHPVSPEDFKIAGQSGFSPQLAIEHFSSLANYVPNFASHSFQETDATVEDLYEMVLAGAQPVSASDTDMGFFAKLKALAQRKFDEEKMGALSGPYQFHPCYADPVDWYDPANPTNWLAHSFSLEQTTPSALSPAAPRPPAMVGGVSAVWRGAPTVTHIANTVQNYPEIVAKLNPDVKRDLPMKAAPHPVGPLAIHVLPSATRKGPASPVMHPAVAPARPIARAATAPPALKLVSGAATHPVSPLYRSVIFDPHMNFTERAMVQRALLQNAPARMVSSDKFSISFKYCVVRVHRPWFYDAFIFDKNWFIPGYKAGSFSTGTAQSNNGIFPAIPIALVAVKDLQITANWSEADASNAKNAMSFGPFSLAGSKFDNNALSCAGMQVIAWIFNVLPPLPVNADPATKAPPKPDTDATPKTSGHGTSFFSQLVSAVGDVEHTLATTPSHEKEAAAMTALQDAVGIVANNPPGQNKG